MPNEEPVGQSLAAGGDPGNVDPSTQGTQGKQEATVEAPEWVKRLDGFDEKARGRLSRFKSEKDLAKSYLEADSRLGRSVIIPGQDATPDERAAFWKRLGRPEKQDEYELDEVYLPDGVTKIGGEESFRRVAIEAGLTKDQARVLHKFAAQTAIDGLTSLKQQAEMKRKEAAQVLRKEYGEEYDRNLALLKKVRTRFGNDAFDRFLNTTGAGNDPDMIRFLVAIGKQMAEDTLEQGRVPGREAEEREPGVLEYQNRPELRRTEVRTAR